MVRIINKSCAITIPLLPFLGVPHWIDKRIDEQNSRECLMEHFVSSSTKIMMTEFIVHQLCRERNNDLDDEEFHRVSFFYSSTFFALPVFYLSEVFKTCLVSFWS